jgi:hypothetical protein
LYELAQILTIHVFCVSIGIALGYELNDRGFESRQRLGIFLFNTASRPVLGLAQPPDQWVPATVSLGVKGPRMSGAVLPLPNTPSWRQLKARGLYPITLLPFLQTGLKELLVITCGV